MNPYEELGVPKDASKEEVKRAYRRAAQEHHPDKGGDSGKFQRVNAAHKLLTDKTKRARYDATGTIDGVDNRQAEALNMLAGLFTNALDQLDWERVDVVAEIKKHLEGEIKRVKAQQADIRAKCNKREKALKKLRRKKKGDSHIHSMLEHEIAKMRAAADHGDTQIEQVRYVISIVDEYEFEVGEASPQPSTGAHRRIILEMKT